MTLKQEYKTFVEQIVYHDEQMIDLTQKIVELEKKDKSLSIIGDELLINYDYREICS